MSTLIDYFLGRILRIYPLFVLSVFVYYYLGTAGIDSHTDTFKAITFQQGYAHLWTVPVEFKFYFVLPLLALVGRYLYSHFGSQGLLISGLLFTVAHQSVSPYWLSRESSIDTFQYLPAFLFGVIGAILKANNVFPQITQKAIAIGSFILVAVFASTPIVRYMVLDMAPSDYLMNKYLFFCFGWTVFIFSQVNSRGFLSRFFVSRPLSIIGLYSYSIYLIHWLVLAKVSALYPGKFGAAAAVLVISIALGFFMYVFFEKPLLAARKRLTANKRLQSRVSGATAL